MEASEKLTSTDLVTIQPPFAEPTLEPGQGLLPQHPASCRRARCSRAATSTIRTMTAFPRAAAAQPDLQGWTIWETIANTIDDDDLTVYLVLDEAHRGFNARPTATSRRSSAS